MRLRPDDDVYRVKAVWLGPKGLTLPWTARYLAYSIWLAIFLLILLVEAVTPLHVGVPPVWEFSLSVLLTYFVTGLIDHDRPLRSLVELVLTESRSPRARPATSPTRLSVTRIRRRSRQ